MARVKTPFVTVPDTNVVLASHLSKGAASPNKEYFERWKNKEFELVYSEDTLGEYLTELLEHGVPQTEAKAFITRLRRLATYVEIQFYHLLKYPVDANDISFLLCADNAQATHLITYDPHLLNLKG